MRLRIDDSRPPVNVAAGYKNNARKAMNYVRDRHIDRLAYVRCGKDSSIFAAKEEGRNRKEEEGK